jgi:hypothetical protein
MLSIVGIRESNAGDLVVVDKHNWILFQPCIKARNIFLTEAEQIIEGYLWRWKKLLTIW